MINRRHFLQFAGSTIATLGISHLNIIQQGNRYAQVLAQNTPRKLALLVGINKYPTSGRLTNLRGCVNDVQLQEELLVHRFGFNRQDIIKLTTDDLRPNYQPTRKNILTAFEEHLINQAQPSDVVVFHFSGHGSQLRDPNPIQNCGNENFGNLNSTLVVADESQDKLAPDIMGRTLFLLRSALKTDNVTMVLDSCHSGGGTRGNLIIRSVPGDNLDPLPEEIAYQQRWMKKLGLTEEEFRQRRCAGVGKGVVIAAAKHDEEAADNRFDGFHAGAFTYLLTQYLWQQKDNVGSAIAEIKNTIRPISRQVPVVDGNNTKPIYFISSTSQPSDAIISKIEGKKITLWLGGVDYDSLTAFQTGASFAIVNNTGLASGKLELTSPRNGLVAEAKLVEPVNTPLQPGTLLQESSRVIPADLKLRIGLDPSVSTEANTALSKINRIEPVTAQQENSLYPGQVQYILSRMTAKNRLRLQKQGVNNLPAVDSIGLFTPGLDLIPESFGQPEETPTSAVSRLEAKMKALLAALIIKKTLNSNSSQLNVEVRMNLVEQPNKILARTATLQNRAQPKQIYPNRLPLNQLLQFQVANNTSDNLYVTILLIDSSGDLVVVFPYGKTITNDSMIVKPNQTLIAGQPGKMELRAVQKGSAEALIIASRSPLKNAVKSLQTLALERSRDYDPIDIGREPVEVISDLLDDLTTERGIAVVEAKEVRTVDIATLSLHLVAI